MSKYIETDNYGFVPETMYRKLRRLKVTIAEWENIADAFEIVAESPIDFTVVDRYLDRNTVKGIYQEPWPFNPVDVVAPLPMDR